MPRRLARALHPALVGLALVYCLAPVAWQAITSLKPTEALYLIPPSWLPWPPSGEHYLGVFRGRAFGENIVNSLVVAGSTTLAALGLGAPAAFSLARGRVPASQVVLAAVLGVSAFPSIVLVSPLFGLFSRIGLLNTYLGLILPHTALTLPLTIWLLTATFREVPPDTLAAAEIDGCTPGQALWRVGLPLAAPGLATAGILTFIYSWNEFLFALSLAGAGEVRTVTVAIALFPGLGEFPWGEIAAASLIVTAPLVFLVLLLQRRIVAGLTTGALSG